MNTNIWTIGLAKDQLMRTKGNTGEIAYIADIHEIYVAMDENGIWSKLCDYEETLPKEEARNKPRICVQCGAPLKRHSHKCEYCDTEY